MHLAIFMPVPIHPSCPNSPRLTVLLLATLQLIAAWTLSLWHRVAQMSDNNVVKQAYKYKYTLENESIQSYNPYNPYNQNGWHQ